MLVPILVQMKLKLGGHSEGQDAHLGDHGVNAHAITNAKILDNVCNEGD